MRHRGRASLTRGDNRSLRRESALCAGPVAAVAISSLMKTTSKPHVAALAALALGLAGQGVAQTPAFPQNQNQTRISAGSRMTLTQFTPAEESFGLRKLAGNVVRDARGDQIGNVSDFLIEPASGKLRYAIVPSGRGASGETFRLIPAAALTKASANTDFVAKIARGQWDQVGTMVEQEVGARVSLNGEQVQRLSRQFAVQDDGSSANNLVRTSSLLAQSLVSANEQIATIDDVHFDFTRQSTAAVVVPTGAAAVAGQKFVVPFTQLQVATEGQGAITTSLTRADLQAQSAFGGLTPTGYVSGDATTNAIQQALANNRALGSSNVQVATETRVVLRGTVQTQRQRDEIERTAAAAAPGATIDNQIAVRRR
jgi:sporulation protein YlmC with PRC-barrel domain